MKFICSLLIIGITIITKSQCQSDHTRLSRVLSKIEELKDADDKEVARIFKNLNTQCVKNFLKLPRNYKMFIDGNEEIIFLAAATIKCANQNFIFNDIINKYAIEDNQKWTKCFAWKLQQLEPTSPLVGNPRLSAKEINDCKKRIEDEVLGDIFERKDNAQCSSTLDDDVEHLKFICKAVLVNFGNSANNVKKAEKEKMKEWFNGIIVRTAECLVKQFEKNPEANQIADSLSSFLQQTVTVDNDPMFEEVYASLRKLIGNIDLTCVRNQLKITQNGNLPMIKAEAEVLIGSAMSQCVKNDKSDFVIQVLNFFMGIFQPIHIYCAKYNLHKSEPNSKLLKNFVVDNAKEADCKLYGDISFHPFSTTYYSYKESVGGELNDSNCGVISQDLMNIFLQKALLIDAETDVQLKKSESKELFDAVKSKLQPFASCVLNRVK